MPDRGLVACLVLGAGVNKSAGAHSDRVLERKLRLAASAYCRRGPGDQG